MPDIVIVIEFILFATFYLLFIKATPSVQVGHDHLMFEARFAYCFHTMLDGGA